jgi:hypothetical protein
MRLRCSAAELNTRQMCDLHLFDFLPETKSPTKLFAISDVFSGSETEDSCLQKGRHAKFRVLYA